MNIPNDCVMVRLKPDFYRVGIRLETWHIHKGVTKTIPLDIYEKVMDRYGCLEVVSENDDFEAQSVQHVKPDKTEDVKKTIKILIPMEAKSHGKSRRSKSKR